MHQFFGIFLTLLLLLGCQASGYWGQAAKGQISLLQGLEPIEALYANLPESSPIRHKIRVIKSVLVFSRAIGLDHDYQYTSVATDITGPVVWNVYAAPYNSVEPLQHCFPIAGCVAYRGYFDPEMANAYAASLEDYDVMVSGVAAYSSLGYFNDPVLASFFDYDDVDLAKLLFHELAHSTLYLDGGAELNESFATVLEYEALRQWLIDRGREDLYGKVLRDKQIDASVFSLIDSCRERLEILYSRNLDNEAMLSEKRAVFNSLREEYIQLSKLWHDNRYDHWFSQDLNNASLIPMQLYHGQVSTFEGIMNSCERNIVCYLDQVAHTYG